MLKLPAIGSKTRELMDVDFLVTLGDRENVRKLQPFGAAVRNARAYLAAEVGAKSVNVHCLRADGDLWLVRVTPRAWAKVWNFGAV